MIELLILITHYFLNQHHLQKIMKIQGRGKVGTKGRCVKPNFFPTLPSLTRLTNLTNFRPRESEKVCAKFLVLFIKTNVWMLLNRVKYFTLNTLLEGWNSQRLCLRSQMLSCFLSYLWAGHEASRLPPHTLAWAEAATGAGVGWTGKTCLQLPIKFKYADIRSKNRYVTVNHIFNSNLKSYNDNRIMIQWVF